MGLLSRKDHFNQALEHYRKLRGLQGEPDRYMRELTEVVRLCREALRGLPTNGDAYVMLANGYQLMAIEAQIAGDTETQDRLMSLASAVICEWAEVPNWTRNRSQGSEVLAQITQHYLEKGMSIGEVQTTMVATRDAVLSQALGTEEPYGAILNKSLDLQGAYSQDPSPATKERTVSAMAQYLRASEDRNWAMAKADPHRQAYVREAMAMRRTPYELAVLAGSLWLLGTLLSAWPRGFVSVMAALVGLLWLATSYSVATDPHGALSICQAEWLLIAGSVVSMLFASALGALRGSLPSVLSALLAAVMGGVVLTLVTISVLRGMLR